MTRRKRTPAQCVAEGREIQQQYDRGWSWARVAAEFGVSPSGAQRLAKAYRDHCDRKAHENQLPLFE